MTTERKLLELPEGLASNLDFYFHIYGKKHTDSFLADIEDYARANMAPLEAEIARLRELLREAE